MRSKITPLLIFAAVLLGQLAGPVCARQSSRASPSQQRSAQLGTRHGRAAGDSGRGASHDDATSAPVNRTLNEIPRLEKECLEQVNLVRKAHGVSTLGFDEELLQVARAYSRRMAEEKFFAHEDPEGRTVRQRVDLARIKWQMLGENLAFSNGYLSPVAASLHGWMESEPHRRNMLDPSYTLSAIGVWISSNGTVYFTEIFLRR
ncbi:MAG: CAP domain-containing protein [Acidobacteriota bacterium]